MITARADTHRASAAMAEMMRMTHLDAIRGMDDGLAAGEHVAKIGAGTMVKVRTGALFKSIYHSTSVYVGRLFATAPYAMYVEKGTRPHVIAARNVQFLRFMWHGVLTFRRRVMHPGTKPQPFMARSAGPTAQAIVTETQRHLNASAVRLFR